jgi:hypothetical protein
MAEVGICLVVLSLAYKVSKLCDQKKENDKFIELLQQKVNLVKSYIEKLDSQMRYKSMQMDEKCEEVLKLLSSSLADACPLLEEYQSNVFAELFSSFYHYLKSGRYAVSLTKVCNNLEESLVYLQVYLSLKSTVAIEKFVSLFNSKVRYYKNVG